MGAREAFLGDGSWGGHGTGYGGEFTPGGRRPIRASTRRRGGARLIAPPKGSGGATPTMPPRRPSRGSCRASGLRGVRTLGTPSAPRIAASPTGGRCRLQCGKYRLQADVMLDELIDVIETVRKRILDHRSNIENYERRTRVSLIDPVLTALGWDVADPTAVTIEPRVEKNWADYALLTNNGRTIVLFVEAKKLSDTETPISQVIGYATAEPFHGGADVRYCASTNGDLWQLIDTRERKYLFSVSLVKDDSAKCALQLLGLWRPAMADGSYIAPVEPVAVDHEPPNDGVDSRNRAASPPVEVVEADRDSQPPTPSLDWTPLTAEFETIGKSAPSAFRLPNGQEIATKYWIRILIETTKWLHQTGMLTSANCRMSMSDGNQTKAFLLSPDGRHTQRAFYNAEKIAEGIFLECNLSSREIVHQMQRLLRRFNYDPAKVYLKLASS